MAYQDYKLRSTFLMAEAATSRPLPLPTNDLQNNFHRTADAEKASLLLLPNCRHRQCCSIEK
jgi:hypothetical protein